MLLEFNITVVQCVIEEGEVCFPRQFKHAQVRCVCYLLSVYVLLVCYCLY